MGTFFAKWWPTIVAILGVVTPILLPAAQHFIVSHPALSAALGGVYAVLTHLLPSPVVQSSTPATSQKLA